VGIESLRKAFRAEMVKQNNRSSLHRNYQEADRIRDQIRELQTSPVRGIRFDENWRK